MADVLREEIEGAVSRYGVSGDGLHAWILSGQADSADERDAVELLLSWYLVELSSDVEKAANGHAESRDAARAALRDLGGIAEWLGATGLADWVGAAAKDPAARHFTREAADLLGVIADEVQGPDGLNAIHAFDSGWSQLAVIPEPATEPQPVISAEPQPVISAEPQPVIPAEPQPVIPAEPQPVIPTEPQPVIPAGEPSIEETVGSVADIPVSDSDPPDPPPAETLEEASPKPTHQAPAAARVALIVIPASLSRSLLIRQLFEEGIEAVPADNWSDAEQLLSRRSIDLVFASWEFGGDEIAETLITRFGLGHRFVTLTKEALPVGSYSARKGRPVLSQLPTTEELELVLGELQ